MRGRAEPKNHNPTLHKTFLSYLPITIFKIVACLGHILESTKVIEMKLGTYIDVNKRK